MIVDHALLSHLDDVKKEKISISTQDRAADYFISYADGQLLFDERGVRVYSCAAPFRETHILHNVALAVAIARKMGMEWPEIERQIGSLRLPKRRFEMSTHQGICLIDDAYNANPDSMRAALSNLPAPKEGGKRIAVLGSMKELGSLSDELHREVGRHAQGCVDLVLALGAETLPLCEECSGAEHFASHEAIAVRLRALIAPGDVVLFKGSRSMELERVLGAIQASS